MESDPDQNIYVAGRSRSRVQIVGEIKREYQLLTSPARDSRGGQELRRLGPPQDMDKGKIDVRVRACRGR